MTICLSGTSYRNRALEPREVSDIHLLLKIMSLMATVDDLRYILFRTCRSEMLLRPTNDGGITMLILESASSLIVSICLVGVGMLEFEVIVEDTIMEKNVHDTIQIESIIEVDFRGFA